MCLAGAVVASWSLTQEVAGSSPFTVVANRSIFVTEFAEFSGTLRKNSIARSRISARLGSTSSFAYYIFLQKGYHGFIIQDRDLAQEPKATNLGSIFNFNMLAIVLTILAAILQPLPGSLKCFYIYSGFE